MLRIALNLIGYTPGCGGVETYVTGLLAALQKVDRKNRYLVICDEAALSGVSIWAENFSCMAVPYQRGSIRGLLRGGLRRLCGIDILAGTLAGLAIDVMHHPLTVLNPPGLSYPSVLTFHDMQQEFFPEFFSPRELQQRRESYLPSVREARRIITVSSHVRTCLVERYGVGSDKIHVVYSGCGEEFRVRDQEECRRTVNHLAITRPFILYPAASWPHKNHQRLLEAVGLLRDRHRFDGQVLLTGAAMDGHRDLMSAIDRLKLADQVRWLGYLPREELACLYNLAQFMVFPSLFEGFGLPVVEAMASGCPVVCSDCSSLPEVGGEAVLYVDPASSDDIAEKLLTLWHDPLLRSNLRQRGLAQAARFRWDETARATAQVYQQAAGDT